MPRNFQHVGNSHLQKKIFFYSIRVYSLACALGHFNRDPRVVRVQTTAPSRGSRRHVVDGLRFVTKCLLAWPKAPPGVKLRLPTGTDVKNATSSGIPGALLSFYMRCVRCAFWPRGAGLPPRRCALVRNRNMAPRPHFLLFFFIFRNAVKCCSFFASWLRGWICNVFR